MADGKEIPRSSRNIWPHLWTALAAEHDGDMTSVVRGLLLSAEGDDVCVVSMAFSAVMASLA
jgi:hypothetical protein